MAVRLVHGRMQLGCGSELALKGRMFGWRVLAVAASQPGETSVG